MVSMLGMFAHGLPFLYGLAVGAALAVAIAVLAAVTLLPALLGFVGRNIDAWLRLHRRPPAAKRPAAGTGGAGVVQRRPVARRRLRPGRCSWRSPLPVLALRPRLRRRRATSPPGRPPARPTTCWPTGFGPGFNGPFVVARRWPTRPAGDLRRDPAPARPSCATTPGVGVGRARRRQPVGPAPLIVRSIPTTSPQDAATAHLLHQLRDDVVPAAVAGTGAEVHVGGDTPAQRRLHRRLLGAAARCSSARCSAAASCCSWSCSARCSCRSRRWS